MNMFDEEDEKALAPIEAEAEYTDKTSEDNKEAEEDSDTSTVEYYELPSDTSARSMIWSVLSLVFGIFGVVSSLIYPLGLIFCLVSIASSLYSRKRLGYFDRTSVFGLIAGIFAAVFSVASLVISVSGIFDKL